MPDKKIPTLVKTFEEFAMFCRNKWRAAFLALFVLTLLGGIFLSIYWGYRQIQLLGTELNKGVEILEESHTSKEDLQEDFEQSVYDNILIEQEMTKCVFTHGADAMLVFKFHNSRTDLQGKHDFFYSATNEVMRPGVPSILPETQSIPIVRLGKFVTPMIEDKCQIVNVSEIEGNSWLRARLEDQNIKTLITCPIYDFQKNLLGFSELVYLNETDFPKGDELNFIMDCFHDTTQDISIIMQK